uniref:Uncharacterized protein n=1 Tax=Lactuca sativa TaxID=4236 RepID=A0A9R1V876_LACSA|nr:hypothetical protein LSAT_V11C600337180 [Lactuca sativa]
MDKEVKTKKVDVSQQKVKKQKIKVETSPLNDYISIPKDDEFDLIDKIKTKVLCDEQYGENWYIDSGCPCHMTGRKGEFERFSPVRECWSSKLWEQPKVKSQKIWESYKWKVHSEKIHVCRRVKSQPNKCISTHSRNWESNACR